MCQLGYYTLNSFLGKERKSLRASKAGRLDPTSDISHLDFSKVFKGVLCKGQVIE